jgi:hypothetical protein
MNAKVLDQFVQVPYEHYREVGAVMDDLIKQADTLLCAIENPGFFTQRKLLTKILPACKQAIQDAQAEANLGEIARNVLVCVFLVLSIGGICFMFLIS